MSALTRSSPSLWWKPRLNRAPSAREWHLVTKASEQAAGIESLTDGKLTDAATALRSRTERTGVTLDDETMIQGSALVREAIRRTTGRTLYPVQLLAGMVLSTGSITEMQTGEGKTLTSGVPGYLCALQYPGVHVATPNAYLAERDCHELKPAYEMLGLRVGLLPEKHDPKLSRQAYQSDITYGTGYEYGFDFLRDQLTARQRPTLPLGGETILSLRGLSCPDTEFVQAGHHCSLVDEIDSVLLDEAMTPLVLSVPGTKSKSGDLLYRLALQCAERLVRSEHYQVDQQTKTARLNESGVKQSFIWLAAPHEVGLPAQIDLAADLKRAWTQYVEQALHAKLFLRRDVDYIVIDNEIQIVDQKTGRIFSERSWRAGLHQAVEMREGVTISDEKASAARITRQRYYQLYKSLAGMTGTATGSESEFSEFYKLPVVVIPLNKPTQRQLLPDRFFESISAKFAAAAIDTEARHSRGQPVLLGTRTIADSEQLSSLLTQRRVPHAVLNGKQDRSEADIVSEAGHFGRVTIATNMAGRGTDIKPDARAMQAGGLHVLGIERYESRRIDRQLAGRAARAGACGSAQFFLSAEDEMLIDKMPRLAKRIKHSCGKNGESRVDFSNDIMALQSDLERRGFLSRRQMVHQDRWLENVLDTLCRETAK